MPKQPPADKSVRLITPILKWPGGKRWFVARHMDVLPKQFNRYIEPFAGSASLFFALQPTTAILCDKNEELIATYRAIRSRSGLVKSALEDHAQKHSDAYYYQVRATKPTSLIAKAARMLYLNRTCFNGIYRVNHQGIFNVPRGSKDAVMLDTDDFSAVAAALRKAELIAGDFSDAINKAQKGDFIFADPPYTVQHNNNGFIKYNEKIFSWEDQVRLADCLAAAVCRGANVVSTNANHQSVRDLYSSRSFTCRVTSRFSAISGGGQHRGQYEELIITSSSKRESPANEALRPSQQGGRLRDTAIPN